MRSCRKHDVPVIADGGISRLTAAEHRLQIHLSESDRVKLEQQSSTGVYFQRGDLRYYIEKDFTCEHPRPVEALEPRTETFSKK